MEKLFLFASLRATMQSLSHVLINSPRNCRRSPWDKPENIWLDFPPNRTKAIKLWCDAMLLTNAPRLVVSEARSLHKDGGWAIRATPHAIQDAERTVTVGWGAYTCDEFQSLAIERKALLKLKVPITIKHKRVQEETRNDSVVTLDYKSKFHRGVTTTTKDGKTLELPFRRSLSLPSG